jgi:arginine exporter protein ArgO
VTTMTHLSARRRRALATALVGLSVGAALIATEVWNGAPVTRAIGGLAFLLAFVTVLLVFQMRSETVSTLAGDPVDERWKIINDKALVGAANISAVVALAGFGISELMGRDNWQFALMAIVISLSYLAGLIWHRGRM